MGHDKYVEAKVLNWSHFSRASTDEYSSDEVHNYLLYLKENFDLDLYLLNKDVNIKIPSNDRIILSNENNNLELVKDDNLNQVNLLYNNKY